MQKEDNVDVSNQADGIQATVRDSPFFALGQPLQFFHPSTTKVEESIAERIV
jgi:hypothetical protein